MKEFKMTKDQLDTLLLAMKRTPVMKFGSHVSGLDLQERANEAWRKLGEEMGFDHMTVRPTDKGERWFAAEPLPKTL